MIASDLARERLSDLSQFQVEQSANGTFNARHPARRAAPGRGEGSRTRGASRAGPPPVPSLSSTLSERLLVSSSSVCLGARLSQALRPKGGLRGGPRREPGPLGLGERNEGCEGVLEPGFRRMTGGGSVREAPSCSAKPPRREPAQRGGPGAARRRQRGNATTPLPAPRAARLTCLLPLPRRPPADGCGCCQARC